MGNVIKWVKWVFDWRFLPFKFQKWLFETGTRAVKFVNAARLMGFAMVLFGLGDVLYKYKLYDKFESVPPPISAAVMLVLAALQIVSMVGKTDRSQIVGGYMLICSGFVWFMVAVAFWASYPPLSTGVVFPSVMALICPLAGDNLIKLMKQYDMGKKGV